MATSPHSIHHAAAAGYQANADRYVLGRPDYPAEIAVWLREVLELQPGKTVIDSVQAPASSLRVYWRPVPTSSPLNRWRRCWKSWRRHSLR